MMNRLEESLNKVELIRSELKNTQYDGVIIKKQPNFSWITSGGRGFVGLASELACASVVVTKDGVYLSANSIEAPRLLAEELPEGFAEVVALPWEQDSGLEARMRQNLGNLTDDTGMDSWFRKERVCLTDNEIERFEKAGAEVNRILENVCLEIQPGMKEFQIAGMISAGLWGIGIEPITVLIAADERSEQVRHYVPTSKAIQKGVICSLCARSAGLVVSATRIVSFSNDFAENYEKLLQVEAAAFKATVPGKMHREIFSEICNAYIKNGMNKEWECHHQGGMTGYLAREVRVDSNSMCVVENNQAYAWNPSAPGAKCEDTVLVTPSGIKVLSKPSPTWPSVEIENIRRPLILRK